MTTARPQQKPSMIEAAIRVMTAHGNGPGGGGGAHAHRVVGEGDGAKTERQSHR